MSLLCFIYYAPLCPSYAPLVPLLCLFEKGGWRYINRFNVRSLAAFVYSYTACTAYTDRVHNVHR